MESLLLEEEERGSEEGEGGEGGKRRRRKSNEEEWNCTFWFVLCFFVSSFKFRLVKVMGVKGEERTVTQGGRQGGRGGNEGPCA